MILGLFIQLAFVTAKLSLRGCLVMIQLIDLTTSYGRQGRVINEPNCKTERRQWRVIMRYGSLARAR